MSLELMQMRMNSIADKLEEIADEDLKKYMNDKVGSFEESAHYARASTLKSVAYVIREEMQITHY